MRKVGWFDIYVENMARAQAFYETVLDTTLASMGDPSRGRVARWSTSPAKTVLWKRRG